MIATSTTQDSVCFIDIKEKYKTMIPRDHRQEKTNSSGWIEVSTRILLLMTKEETKHNLTSARIKTSEVIQRPTPPL
jgi:hypothetical protein